jgi:hypothetical protein
VIFTARDLILIIFNWGEVLHKKHSVATCNLVTNIFCFWWQKKIQKVCFEMVADKRGDKRKADQAAVSCPTASAYVTE